MNRELNKIDSFFENTKDTSLEEFKEFYNNLVFENRFELNRYLLKLFKDYRNEKRRYLRKKKNITEEDKQVIDIIIKTKKIISYLNKEQAKFEKKVIKKQKSNDINIVIKEETKKTSKKKKKKIKKDNFDIEILEFFEYEKNDTLYEFKINIDNFKYHDKEKVKKQLIKLYSKYLKRIITDYHSINIEDDYDSRFISQFKDQSMKVKDILKYLKNDYNKHEEIKIVKVKKPKVKKEKVKTKNEIIATQSALENLENYSFKNAIDIFINSLKTKKIDSYLIEQTKYLVYKYIEEDIKDKDIINGLYLIDNAIIYRYKRTVDKNKKRKLKDIRVLFDFAKAKYKEIKIEQSPLIPVVEYFIGEEDDYLYLKEIVNRLPKIVNLKYNDKHILVYIVDTFIDNYKKLIRNKNSKYINKDYLKSIYFLFLRHPYLSISKEDLKEIDNKLNMFLRDITDITSTKRKNTIKQDIKNMYTKYRYDNKDKILYEIDNYRLDNQLNSINLNPSSRRVDLTSEYTIMLNDSTYAYSVVDKKILKVHILDLYSVIVKESELDNYLYNQTLNQEEIDSFLRRITYIKKGIDIPTVTYEIELSNSQILDIYPSKIRVNKKCHDIDSLKSYVEITNSIDIKQIDNYLLNLLNKSVIAYFEKEKLPIIYSGYSRVEEEKINKTLNDLSYLMSKLDKKDFKTIYNVIDNDLEEYHYSTHPFKGENDLNILNPLNYVTIMHQRIVHEIISEDRNTPKEKEEASIKYQKEVVELVATLNYYNNYIDKEVLNENKGKLVKKRKMYI